MPLPVPATPNVNPFVAHLQSLYSQSPVSNAGTRGEDAYGTYVPTALDEHLIPDVLDGSYRLVIITGNAGDGKTAFLERLIARPPRRGGQRGCAAGERDRPAAGRTAAGCAPTTTAARTRATGPTTTSCRVLRPVRRRRRRRTRRETRLIAINAGPPRRLPHDAPRGSSPALGTAGARGPGGRAG